MLVSHGIMEAVIRPIRNLAALVALEGPRNTIHLFRIGVTLIILTVAVGTRQFLNPVNDSKGIIIAAVEFASYNFRLPTSICCLIMTNRKSRYIGDFITSMVKLDKKFNSMGFPVDYGKAKRLVRSLVGLVFFKLFLQQIPFCMRGSSWDATDYFDYIIFNVPILIIHVLLTQWIIYLFILRLHFKTLNTILKMFHHGQCWVVQDFRLGKTLTIQRDIVRTCGIIYDNLCTLSEQINEIFAWQILFLIPTLFMMITYNSFQTCRMVKDLTHFDAGWVLFDVLYFAVFLELVIPGAKVREECDKFADILHKIKVNGITEAVNSLILQTHHQKVEFSACGVFALDGTLIYAVLGALTTYLVILLQFDL